MTYGQNNGSNRDARYIKSLYSHILDDEDLLLLEDSVAEVDVDSMETWHDVQMMAKSDEKLNEKREVQAVHASYERFWGLPNKGRPFLKIENIYDLLTDDRKGKIFENIE